MEQVEIKTKNSSPKANSCFRNMDSLCFIFFNTAAKIQFLGEPLKSDFESIANSNHMLLLKARVIFLNSLLFQ